MARTRSISALFIALLFLFNPINSDAFSRQISRREIGLPKKQKLSHLRFFFHDIVSGPTPTTYEIATSPITNSSLTGFGSLSIIDDPLTIEPNISSRIVGRAQGVYASADMNRLGLLMAMNFVFLEGKFNGSTLAVLGRNDIFAAVKELPILGGSGVFRFASGYALARTHELNVSTGDAVVEYNLYVFHY